MPSEKFVAQHHRADAGSGASSSRVVVGYFATLQDAQAALDERFEDGCWQGISNHSGRERWWREGDDRRWHGPLRAARH